MQGRSHAQTDGDGLRRAAESQLGDLQLAPLAPPQKQP